MLLRSHARSLVLAARDFHTDYFPEVGTHALTLIAPLATYEATENFQMSYHLRSRDHADDAAAKALADEVNNGEPIGRYVYRKGKAVVFGSRFLHSTEPGQAANGQLHAYLCFTFGTDDQSRWPQIERTLGTQSRLVMHPDGVMRLSSLGQAIESALEAMREADAEAEAEVREVEAAVEGEDAEAVEGAPAAAGG